LDINKEAERAIKDLSFYSSEPEKKSALAEKLKQLDVVNEEEDDTAMYIETGNKRSHE
jgi:hypothetical protein